MKYRSELLSMFTYALSAVLSSHGILHQSTCPHTPQQNGITERKN